MDAPLHRSLNALLFPPLEGVAPSSAKTKGERVGFCLYPNPFACSFL